MALELVAGGNPCLPDEELEAGGNPCLPDEVELEAGGNPCLLELVVEEASLEYAMPPYSPSPSIGSCIPFQAYEVYVGRAGHPVKGVEDQHASLKIVDVSRRVL